MKNQIFVSVIISILILSLVLLCKLGYETRKNLQVPESMKDFYTSQEKVSVNFISLDYSDRIVVKYHSELELSNTESRNLDEIHKVIQIVETYSNNWVEFHYEKNILLEITGAPLLQFYSDDQLIGVYQIRRNMLIYRQDGASYWRYVNPNDLQEIIEVLDIPDKALDYP